MSTQSETKVRKSLLHTVEHILHRIMHIMEVVIAAVTILLLAISLAAVVGHVIAEPEVFTDASHFLHQLLTIVVGLEFVKMLLDTTPANILEVLTVAITRHVVLSHEDPWSNLACIACIAGLFAIRRFLVSKEDLDEELTED